MAIAAQHADALRLEVASVEVDHLTAVQTIPGVVITAAADRNGPGIGWLRSTEDGTLLSWKAPESSNYGSGQPCDADGSYLLEDGDDVSKWVRCQVYVDFLSSQSIEARVFLADIYNNDTAHDDVTASEAAAGNVETWTLTMENAGTLILSFLKVWIDSAVSGLEISDDGASWVSPTTESTALEFPDLLPGATDTLHIRRTISAAADSDPDVLNHLHITFSGL